ncbi:scavenger receptor cysteine-rich type 1 protein M130-like [Siniperca chuatsi]|uniref:scavenger receptor cysteine-rich type 1 protein M130-like n=1 Tax=Siniperca chuatsi TaxID=119488 RepID=UPI001CE1DDF3|nr:scavenger receptor cysteine-rich type 1 protein M130-like [Siniperca chuatsi]
MNHILTVFMLLWSSGLQAKENDSPETGNIRLMGGATRCAGELEMKLHNDWKPVDDDISFGWNLRTAAIVCRQLDCGSAVSTKIKNKYLGPVWKINASSVQSGSALRDYISMTSQSSSSSLEITCSESVRLVNAPTLCSGRVEVKANQSWSSVCKGDSDSQNVEVVCRELGCGAPLKLQLALYENMKTLEWTKEFQCKGNESTLLDCESYESARNTCSPIRLTCSEPDNVRLVEGGSRCAGTLEMKLQDEWRPVDGLTGDLKSAALVCRQLNCGFAVSTELKGKNPSVAKSVWGIISSTVQSGSALRERVSTRPWYSSSSLEISCSDLLFQPIISVSPSIDGVYESSSFTISCSIKPQYPGGSFQLTFTTSDTTHSYTQKAVTHTAHFLFPAADDRHQGNYSCVYHIFVFSHNFSSESQPLSLSISASPTVFIIRCAGLLLTLAFFLSAIGFLKKTTRGQKPGGQEDIELDNYNLGASRAEVGPNEEARAQNSESNIRV